MVLALKLFAQLPPVESAGGRGRLSEGRLGIHGEVAVMRMLLAKVIARLRLRLGVGEDSLQLLDERLQILAGKFPAEPKHETWYVAHGGESLGNLAGSLHDEMGKRDFTAFLRGRQVPLTPFHRPPRDADQLNLHMWPTDRKKGGESQNPRISRTFKSLPAKKWKIFDRTGETKKMLEMKVGLDMLMKTKDRRKWKTSGPDMFMKTNELSYFPD